MSCVGELVMQHVWMSPVTCVIESFHINELGTLHARKRAAKIWTNHVTQMHMACHIYTRVVCVLPHQYIYIYIHYMYIYIYVYTWVMCVLPHLTVYVISNVTYVYFSITPYSSVPCVIATHSATHWNKHCNKLQESPLVSSLLAHITRQCPVSLQHALQHALQQTASHTNYEIPNNQKTIGFMHHIVNPTPPAPCCGCGI